MKEDAAARRWGFELEDSLAVVALYPGERRPAKWRKVGGPPWDGAEDAVARAAELAFAEAPLLSHIKEKRWTKIGREQLDGLADWVLDRFVDGVAEARSIAAARHSASTAPRLASRARAALTKLNALKTEWVSRTELKRLGIPPLRSIATW